MMKSKLEIRSLLTIAVAGLTLFACSFVDQAGARKNVKKPPPNSGVFGQVLLGPIHDGPVQAGEAADLGFSAPFHVYNSYAEEVATFYSDTNGMFRVELQPGNYIIIPDSSAPMMNADQQSHPISVTKDVFSKVTLVYDYGQR